MYLFCYIDKYNVLIYSLNKSYSQYFLALFLSVRKMQFLQIIVTLFHYAVKMACRYFKREVILLNLYMKISG